MQQRPVPSTPAASAIDVLHDPSRGAQAIAPDLAYLRTGIANVYFRGRPGAADREWVLIDTGMPGAASRIRAAAADRFAPGARPRCIVLTHGHFDHVGAVRELAQAWDVPVYAHPLELPYLTGLSSYAPPDPTVGGGAMTALSFLYPRRPIDLHDRVGALPADGSVPGMPGWRWIHTPGHTHGHVSLFRDDDGALIAGDAVITVKQESLLAVLSQRPTLHGPPAYFTVDWDAARESVRHLASLQPDLLATGHGAPLAGADMRRLLEMLAADFDELAVPGHGRYVHYPAIADSRGVVMIPGRSTRTRNALWIAGGVVLGAWVLSRTRRGGQ